MNVLINIVFLQAIVIYIFSIFMYFLCYYVEDDEYIDRLSVNQCDQLVTFSNGRLRHPTESGLGWFCKH